MRLAGWSDFEIVGPADPQAMLAIVQDATGRLQAASPGLVDAINVQLIADREILIQVKFASRDFAPAERWVDQLAAAIEEETRGSITPGASQLVSA